MKILWISNIEFPEALSLLSMPQEFKKTGGWMLGAANALVKSGEAEEFAIASVSRNVTQLTILEGANIKYYLLPYGKGNKFYNSEYEKYWIQIKNDFKPDVVHIHGTEFTHGLAYVRACGSHNVCVSIQGLKSACYQYYNSGLSAWIILKNITIRDIFKGTLFHDKKKFKDLGIYEIEIISRVNHIIGRTSWDRAKTWVINPQATYHICNETLRPEFYEGNKWNYNKCEKHTIFCSQASYPIKGIHQLLKAMPIIKYHYPDAKLRIAGSDITKNSGFWGLKHFSGYGKILKYLIKKYQLEDSVFFIGTLDAKEMCTEYLKCNVFVSPSSIENSPNSVAEAQILGTPVIASFVGGTSDMMRGAENYLYRFEEVEMLAFYICRLFDKKVNEFPMIDTASYRHNPQRNMSNLLFIYKSIINPSV